MAALTGLRAARKRPTPPKYRTAYFFARDRAVPRKKWDRWAFSA